MFEASSFLSLLFATILPLALTGLFVWGFVDALMRTARQFELAGRSKNFWLGILGGGGLLFFAVRMLRLWFPFAGWVSLGFLIAAVFYLGPERQRMGPRWTDRGPRRRQSRGGW